MKRTITLVALMVGVLAFTSCADKKAEKRIAELESRLAQLETNKGGSTASPTTSIPGVTDATAPLPEEKPEGPLPLAQFDNIDHDFGTINEGPKVTHVYKVKNTGEAPLIIQNAQGSCGCTASDWTKEPIPVGGSGFVKAEFDTNGKGGINNKTVTVTANTWPKTTTLRFKAMVTPKSEQNGPTK